MRRRSRRRIGRVRFAVLLAILAILPTIALIVLVRIGSLGGPSFRAWFIPFTFGFILLLSLGVLAAILIRRRSAPPVQ